MLFTVEDNKIYYAIAKKNNLYLSIIQYLPKEKHNVFDSIEELEKSVKLKDYTLGHNIEDRG